MTATVDENGMLSYERYVRKGGMLILREALELDDPDQLYNYLVRSGFEPERYGIYHPAAEEYAGHTRAQLIQELVSLKKELEAIHRSGFI